MQTASKFATSTVGKSVVTAIAVAVALSTVIKGSFDINRGIVDVLSLIRTLFGSVTQLTLEAISGLGDWTVAAFKYLENSFIGAFFRSFVKYEADFTAAGGHLIVVAALFLAEIFISAFHCIKIYRIAQSETISSAQMTSAVIHAEKAGRPTMVTVIAAAVLLAAALPGLVYRAATDATAGLQIDGLFACVLALAALFYIARHSIFEFPAFLLPREIVNFSNVQLNGLWSSYRAKGPVQRLRESVLYHYEFQNSSDAKALAIVAQCKP